MHLMRGFHKQSNLSSSLQDIAGLPDVQNVQSAPQTVKNEPGSQGIDSADAIQLESGDLKCDKQGLGDTAGSSIARRNLSKSTYVSVFCEHPKSETRSPMDTVAEHPNSLPGVVKVCTSLSGTISVPCELPQSMDKEPSSTENTDRLAKKELVSPTDIKHELAKFSEESSRQVTRCSEKVQPKSSIACAPKSYQESRIYTSTIKPRLAVSKEQSQKTATTGNASAKSFLGEVPPLQSCNKVVASNSSQRKDKIYQRIVHVTQEGSNNSTSTELRASDSTASLSDEQLPQSTKGATLPSSSWFTDIASNWRSAQVLKKRNREDILKDSEDTRITEKVSFVERRQRDCSAEHVPSVKDSCRSAENIASEQRNRCVSSTGADTGLTDSVDSIVLRSLPGLIDEIISKNRSITHDELCNAVHQTNSNKRQKGESDSLLADVLQAEKMRAGRDSEERSADLHQEDHPRGRRKATKRRRLELKGRRVRDTRKRSSIDSSPEDAAAMLSDSSSDRNDTPMDDVNQKDNSVAPRIGSYMEAKGADSSS
ncbi:hypothetical protein PR202_gb25741 [Eleusine coracana subsp. coracana]|uniref:DUF7648 domain-containing protein n=1 Tax=Eleusine coracana subsp. coracana TaxID=191504 RepID=A0AAV5FPQ7_ELECO|nr:hypothetical protein PR202_gb25741 [Eleusine coracana subsp. coracana]